MYCYKCGAQLADEANFCTECGTKILKENAEMADVEQYSAEQPSFETPYFEHSDIEQPTSAQPKNKALIRTIIIAAACVVLGVCIWLIVSTSGKANLKKQFLRDWQRVENEGSTYYTLGLDFSEDKIKYTFDSLYVDDTIATYDYEIISGNKFKINEWKTVFTVEFNDDKTMMTITPALTSTEDYEHWFNFN